MSFASSKYYDAIYAFKDYAREAAQLEDLIRSRCPNARTALDVGCGTGEHARFLTANHGLEVDGLDIDAEALRIARRKNPGRSFIQSDMADFSLGRGYDSVLCLFGSIGYVKTLERVHDALRCFRRHLLPGGVVVLEAWLTPDEFEANRTVVQRGETSDGSIERVCRTERVGAISRLHFDFRVESGAGVQCFSEIHELGLFSKDEIHSSFSSVGLDAEFGEGGLTGRGIWLAQASSSSLPFQFFM